MKINIESIPEAGLELTEGCDPAKLDLARTDIKFSEPIDILAQITKGINCISVRLRLAVVMHLICNRCLEEFTVNLSKKVNLNIPIENKAVIDLTDNLREEIILNFPLKPLCRPDCLGLCSVCGQNLNNGKCDCSKK